MEVDGGVHDLEGRRERDAKRDAWLAAEGFTVMRFREAVILSSASWRNDVRVALQAQPEAAYRWKTAPRAAPLESDIGPWWEERE